ncbi:molybdopterin molybdotransferase MoeA [Rhizobiaceae bacterium n13]|uniref:Molybdopterin molybdenumtransferase n=1 Tax=Ferirhizobium litorale TaxID=2927786 RepID=A0AAE3U5V3_9HYPH|nr:gephyrin-like molybdotransferase Glp [Fererhizobium litorale]MDI7864068.1 molybdopterin molybdotransferase MoeA [Fererhizobium litorale]MDI7924449.1 molybdopterin molybdotransferase MoeA [Fererhizobium litorale]
MALLPVSEAQDKLLDKACAVNEIEMVALHEADGRVLAEDLVALLTQPPFDASAMDGYALRAQDASQIGAVLPVIGTSAAGRAFEGAVGQGQTVRIFTGAPVPEGADTVLIQEDAEVLDGGRIRTSFVPIKGRHIRPRGQDFTEGEAILEAGTVLDYTRLTVAAAMNHATVPVLRRPRVAVLATGDELLPPGSALGPSQIIASNSFGIAALARVSGAEVIDFGIVPDDSDKIAAAIDQARAAKPDVIVTLGGASVGDLDLVRSTLLSKGMELDFWKIAMRPGKPLMVGNLGGIHVLGLPGNPVSSLVCALLFLEPLICKLANRPLPARSAMACTSTDLPANDQRQDYLRATLARRADGNLVATSYGKQDSSMMKIFARSDCLIVRPPQAPAIPAGGPCPVLLLRP